MTQIATVEKQLNGRYALISVARKSACGHNCEECAGCGVSGAAVRVRARNPIGAAAGQKVVVQSETGSIMKAILLVYLLPLVLFLLGYFLTPTVSVEGVRYGIAILGFAVGIWGAVRYDRYVRQRGGFQFTITQLF